MFLNYMENKKPTNEIKSKVENRETKVESVPKEEVAPIAKIKEKPPKLEDKPFDEFINNHLIPGLKKSIQDKGSLVKEIKLIEGRD